MITGGGYYTGPQLKGDAASDYIHSLFRSCGLTPHERAVRPYVVLGAMPRGVSPFDERASRLAHSSGIRNG